MPPAPAGPRLARAVLAGFALACFIGGLFLLGVALRGFARPVDCTGFPARECALQRETVRELSRYQTLAGGGLALLGLALGSLLRSRAGAR